MSSVVPKLPTGGLKDLHPTNAPTRCKIFGFSPESMLKLKSKVNGQKNNPTIEISWFQSLCALLWRGITRGRKLPPSRTTSFQMLVNCRHRVEPKLSPHYFGNAVQRVPTVATAGDVLSTDLRWCAEQLHKTVVRHNGAMVKTFAEDWERNPRFTPSANSNGPSLIMGESPRFPMYDDDFGWGRSVAVRNGKGNRVEGVIYAYPRREGGGSVDLEVTLAPETMASLESDPEFMQCNL